MTIPPLRGIVMATVLEAEPFIKGLALKSKETKPFRIYKNGQIILIISGIGKTNAAMATTYIILQFRPATIYNLGAAGATDTSHPLGKTCHIIKVIENDRHSLCSDTPATHIPNILQGFDTATLSSSDSPVKGPLKRKEIATDSDLIDMEGAAVVQVCKRFDTPVIIFKFVSDTSQHTSHKQIVKNIETYRSSFYEFIKTKLLDPNKYKNALSP